jgi:hypothetical protein
MEPLFAPLVGHEKSPCCHVTQREEKACCAQVMQRKQRKKIVYPCTRLPIPVGITFFEAMYE